MELVLWAGDKPHARWPLGDFFEMARHHLNTASSAKEAEERFMTEMARKVRRHA